MDREADCFVSGVLATVLRISRFVGISPLTFIKRKTGWCVSLSPALSMYGYFLVTLLNLSILATLAGDLSLEQRKSIRMRTNTRRILWITDIILLLVSSSVSVYGARGQMKSLISCLNHLQKMNSELHVYNWPVRFEKPKMVLLVVWLLFTMTLTVIDHTYLMIMNSTGTVVTETSLSFWINMVYIFYYVCYWITQLRELQFIMIALHVLNTFKFINESMRNSLFGSNLRRQRFLLRYNKSFHDTNKYKKRSIKIIDSSWISENKRNAGQLKKAGDHQHEKIRKLALVYSSVCEVVREVDKNHGLILILLLGSCFFHLVITPYYLIKSLFETKEHTIATEVHVMVQVFWCIFHAVGLILVIEPCHMTHMEMETTQELLSQLMHCTDSIYDPLSAELELFFRHLTLNQASYSPLRVTTLTRSLVATIFGSVTTYLVVIVQL